jgi:Zn-dependent peptidase ImmA (M78 family)
MKANINPDVLKWARTEAGFSLEDAARKIGVPDTKKKTSQDRLNEWETGVEIPSRNQLAKIAKAYYRPVLTFYMKNPPGQSKQLPDFRTVGDHPASEKNSILDALVRKTIARQEEVVELLTEDIEDVEPLPFIGRFSTRTDPIAIIADIRRELDIDFNSQRSMRDKDTLFRTLRRKAEDVGVFILLQGNLGSHHTDIESEEFRGIALPDPIAPFIVINKNDAKAAHCFTLLHELAHLWLGKGGISNLSPFTERTGNARIEIVCNEVATEFLMPKALFEEVYSRVHDNAPAYFVMALANEFNVSRAAAANRLWKLGHINEGLWWSLYQSYQNEWRRNREKLKEQEGGPSFYITKKSQLGGAMINTVLGAVDSGMLTYTRASRILGVNAKNFDGLRMGAR